MKDSTLTAIRTVLGPMTSEAKCREVYEAVLLSVRERDLTLRYKGPDPGVIHEIQGSPADIWKTLVDALLAE